MNKNPARPPANPTAKKQTIRSKKPGEESLSNEAQTQPASQASPAATVEPTPSVQVEPPSVPADSVSLAPSAETTASGVSQGGLAIGSAQAASLATPSLLSSALALGGGVLGGVAINNSIINKPDPQTTAATPTDIKLSQASLAENNKAGATVATLSATGLSSTTDLVYALVSGTGDTDNSAFTIQGDQLQIKNVANFESKASYSIRLKVTDKAGLSYETTQTISVTDVNEAPTALALSATSLAENNQAGATVATLSATDPDGSASGFAGAFTYALVNGTGDTDNSAFTIQGDQLQIKNVANFESKASYSIRLKVTDKAGLSYETTQTISVTDVNEPTILALSATSLAENNQAGATVATLSATDPDGSASGFAGAFTYALVNGTGDTDNSAFTIQGDQLQIKNVANFESKASYSIRLKVTDKAGLSYETTQTISVTDVNEAPNLSLSRSSHSILENTSTASPIKVADITISDDALGTNTLSLSGADKDNFEIQGNALYLKVGVVLDYETKTSYAVTVSVSDSSLATAPATSNFTLNIGNVDEKANIRSVSLNKATTKGLEDGALNVGDYVDARIDLSEAVKVTGSSTLTLNIGGTKKQASYYETSQDGKKPVLPLYDRKRHD